jgi:hypothetical protein
VSGNKMQIHLLVVLCGALGNRATHGFFVTGHHLEHTDIHIFYSGVLFLPEVQ